MRSPIDWTVLDAGTDQGLAIARCFDASTSTLSLRGMYGSKPIPLRHRRLFDDLVHGAELAAVITNVIPTGMNSTRDMLNQGSVRLGEIEMSPDSLLFGDKLWSFAVAQRVGIPVPRTWRAKDTPLEEYPVFFKDMHEKKTGLRGIAHSPFDIPYNQVDSLITQEFVDTPGTYGVAFLSIDGHLKDWCGHYESESIPRFGGSAVLLTDHASATLVEYVRRLLSESRYSGWGLVEFKADGEGGFVFMELNPKFWASCEFTFRRRPSFFRTLFGVDLPKDYVDTYIFVDRAFERGATGLGLTLKALGHARFIAYRSIPRTLGKFLLRSPRRRN